MNTLRREALDIISDFMKYLDTTVPMGVDREKYTELKYTNRRELYDFLEQHDEYDKLLIEKVAVRDFLSQSDEEMCEKLQEYKEL